VCGRSVFLDAPPARRAETHHIVPRSLAPERINDPENLITVCGSDHRKLTSHELAIVGTSRAAYRVVRGPNFRPGR
jgi:5-methylcytosine-specific restriction endonuclease McrA